MSVVDRDRHNWIEHWQAMSDEELLEERLRLCDFAEDLEPGSGTRAFADWALRVIAALEQHRAVLRLLRDGARMAAPDVDPDAFVSAVVAINRAQRDGDAVETFRGALAFGAAVRELENPNQRDGDNG